MFALIESAPSRRGTTDWTSRMASATLHTALIAGAIVLTQHAATTPSPAIFAIPMPWTPPTAQPQPPVTSSTQTTTVPVPNWAVLPPTNIEIPTEIPPPGTSAFLPNPATDPLPPGTSIITPPGGLPGLGHAIMDARVVDEMPALLAHPPINYPEVLRQAGIEGRVTVEAVLDTLGRAEPSSLHVTASPNPLFDREALAVVLGSRYRPGRVDGRAVRVRIQVPVAFAITR